MQSSPAHVSADKSAAGDILEKHCASYKAQQDWSYNCFLLLDLKFQGLKLLSGTRHLQKVQRTILC